MLPNRVCHRAVSLFIKAAQWIHSSRNLGLGAYAPPADKQNWTVIASEGL